MNFFEKRSVSFLLVVLFGLISTIGYFQPASAQGPGSTMNAMESLALYESPEAEELPKFQMEVAKVKGNPYVFRKETSRWQVVEPGLELNKGDRIVTEKNQRVELEVPEVSLIEVEPRSELVVRELARHHNIKLKQSGIGSNFTQAAENQINLKAITGEVQNKIKRHEQMQTDFELDMVNATVGVRGTTFECEVSRDSSECAVLEGQVEMKSKLGPRRSLLLNSGEQSSITEEKPEPEAKEIDETTREELEQYQEKAERRLRKKPRVEDVQFAGESLNWSVEQTRDQLRMAYFQPEGLEVHGFVRVREPGASLDTVRYKIGDEWRTAGSSSEFEFELRPETLPGGEERNLEIAVQAIDTLGSRSDTYMLNLTLAHPLMDDVVPSQYEEQEMSIDLARVGGRPVSKVELPYRVLARDMFEEPFTIVPEVPDNIEGMAYSLDGGASWERISGEPWEIRLEPERTGPVEPRVIVWTEEGIRSTPVTLGRFYIDGRSMARRASERLADFWQALLAGQTQRARGMVTGKFEARVEDQPLSFDQFVGRLAELNSMTSSLHPRFETEQRQTTGNNTVRLAGNFEAIGRFAEGNESFQWSAPGVRFDFERGPDGDVRLKSMAGFPSSMYQSTGQAIPVTSQRGVNLSRLSSVSADQPHHFRVYRTGEGDWLLELSSQGSNGGVFELATSDIDKVFPIPRMASGLFSQRVRLSIGTLYALRFPENPSLEEALVRAHPVEGSDDQLRMDLFVHATVPGFDDL